MFGEMMYDVYVFIQCHTHARHHGEGDKTRTHKHTQRVWVLVLASVGIGEGLCYFQHTHVHTHLVWRLDRRGTRVTLQGDPNPNPYSYPDPDQHVCLCSEDSDMWIMGCDEWHSGYSTCSTKKYRHVISGRTRVKSLGKMTTAERIRLAMWTSNDYLPGILTGVHWFTPLTMSLLK